MVLNEKIYKINTFKNKTKTLMGWMLLFYSSKHGPGCYGMHHKNI